MANTIPTETRVSYARGFLELGLLAEASAEVAAISIADLHTPEVLEIRTDLFMESRAWGKVIVTAEELSTHAPENEKAWIAWAYALRELQRIEEAREVLLNADPIHGGTSGVLHYNLACYYCLLGNLDEAAKRLKLALAMDPAWRESARDDPDLARLKPMIARL